LTFESGYGIMLALLDTDLLVYRVGWTTLADPEEIAFYRMDEMIRGILEALQTTNYKAFLTSTDHSNFRYDIYPAYKATRKAEKPTHYHRLRDYLLETHGAELVTDQEADDALGIAQHEESCIVTIDKDLNQVPGWHYNFVKKDLYHVTPNEGLRYFYQQILMGDRIDNIPGIHGIGPVNAKRIIDECTTEREMYERVLREYGGRTDEVLRNAQLLKIRTIENEIWQPPTQ
jgi:5'-3' exonuclease